jgi:hypothetical protein
LVSAIVEPPWLSDQVEMALVQCPAVRKPGCPPTVTLKPSEQRAPGPQIASPPAMRVENFPETCLSTALPSCAATCFFSRASASPVTVESAVTTTLSVRGSTAREVPGMLFSVRVCFTALSWAMVCCTILAVAPVFSTRCFAVSSTTFTTSFLLSAS